jgi:hypothetical protein
MAYIQRFDVIENLQNNLTLVLGKLDEPANQLEWAVAIATAIKNINSQLKEVLELMIEMSNYFVDELATKDTPVQPANEQPMLLSQHSSEQTIAAVEVTNVADVPQPTEDHGAKVIEVTIE